MKTAAVASDNDLGLCSRANNRVLAAAIVAILACGGVTGIAIARRWTHYDILGILLQYAVVLPLAIAALRTGDERLPGIPSARLAPLLALGFFVVASIVSWRVSEGAMIPDEESYRFQALTLAEGRLSAPPPPGAPERPGGRAKTPPALYFEHQILSEAGWYSKYPIGWPAVLALPESLNVGWLVSPLLGALSLLAIGLIARDTFGAETVFPAVAMAALSPYFLANSVGRMSHALSGALIAWAAALCIRGLRAGKASCFAWMFLLLTATFHVRPLTALSAAVVLGSASLLGTRTRRALCLRVLVTGVAAAILAVSSFLFYDWRFTGNPLLTPYALARGIAYPVEVSGAGSLLQNLWAHWRWSAQITALFTFPLAALLVAYGVWKSRPDRAAQRILLALPVLLFLAYLLQPEYSGSLVGQRYWFEGYFGIAILAAHGLVTLIRSRQCGGRTVGRLAVAFAAAQVAVMASSVTVLDEMSFPRRQMKRLADQYRNCDCIVYMEDTAPDFYAMHLNPNRPDWPSERVFYMVDRGPAARAEWARLYKRKRWVALRYDARSRAARIDAVGSL